MAPQPKKPRLSKGSQDAAGLADGKKAQWQQFLANAKAEARPDPRFTLDKDFLDSSDGDGGEAIAAKTRGHESEDPNAEDPPSSGDLDERRDSGAATGTSDSGQDDGGDRDDKEAQPQRKRKVISQKKLQRLKEAHERRGIVYISRIPPHMKPQKLRQLLSPHGEIGRIYCALEDPRLRRLRKKKGGNTGKNYTEGWVEFEDKRRAKRAAQLLNGQPIGGKKRSAYYYDLWNIKYLPKFKWDQLTEEINYQRAVREQRLVAEISAAKRERDFYLSRVDKAKAIDAIKERRGRKEQQGGGSDASRAAAAAAAAAAPHVEGGGASGEGRHEPFVRHYGQRKVKADPVLDAAAPTVADDVLGLLGRKRRQ